MSSPVLKAIHSADIDRLRRTLESVVADAHGRALVEKELLVPASTDSSQRSSSSTGKRNRYETCVQCNDEFDVTLNGHNKCSWHTGECKIDWSFNVWADTDEEISGVIDSDESREEFPEGFFWSCCGGYADAAGCRTGFHKEASSAKRSRTVYSGLVIR